MAFWIIFSLGFPTLSGLVSVFPGLGIITLRVGVKSNLPDRMSLEARENHFSLIPSSVILLAPSDILPGLLLILR